MKNKDTLKIEFDGDLGSPPPNEKLEVGNIGIGETAPSHWNKESINNIINKNLMKDSAYTLLSDSLRADLESLLDKNNQEWEDKIEKAMPEKKSSLVNVLEGRGDEIYSNNGMDGVYGYNQAIEDIKNNLNK